MKLPAILFLVTLFFLSSIPPSVYAENRVNIKTNTSGNANVKTDVVVESNGEKIEYHSNEPENTTITSKDGNSTINIETNQNSSKPSPTQSPTNSSVKIKVNAPGTSTKTKSSPSPVVSSSPSASPDQSPEVLGTKTEKKKFSLGEFLRKFFASFKFSW